MQDMGMQETADLLRKPEENTARDGLARMKGLRKRYKQAVQKCELGKAKKLRREYFQQMYINLVTMASPMDLLFPDPKLEKMMDKISQELEY